MGRGRLMHSFHVPGVSILYLQLYVSNYPHLFLLVFDVAPTYLQVLLVATGSINQPPSRLHNHAPKGSFDVVVGYRIGIWRVVPQIPGTPGRRGDGQAGGRPAGDPLYLSPFPTLRC